jgi:hypothetical protein
MAQAYEQSHGSIENAGFLVVSRFRWNFTTTDSQRRNEKSPLSVRNAAVLPCYKANFETIKTVRLLAIS